ncbi:hypothetical protein PR003_g4524 [Phytophthora rubi]|uniref:Uncharacterized protein n=1 Tax=Phytophthora rubi TaxID=129364 RepID=A0A6A4FY89_9STRA|nr:hypothetical protein PR002_g5331 [Phytophthora rubi]KAE9352175.1 hypothetical protein PR003_g4524 [Phytophthora rubi]
MATYRPIVAATPWPCGGGSSVECLVLAVSLLAASVRLLIRSTGRRSKTSGEHAQLNAVHGKATRKRRHYGRAEAVFHGDSTAGAHALRCTMHRLSCGMLRGGTV